MHSNVALAWLTVGKVNAMKCHSGKMPLTFVPARKKPRLGLSSIRTLISLYVIFDPFGLTSARFPRHAANDRFVLTIDKIID
jgi:hypothetical protein